MKSKASTSRRRARKPRFLSLRRQLTTEQAASPPSPADEGNVADRFFAGAEEGCANSLTGLLQPKRDEEEEDELVPAVDSPMSSVSAAYDDARSLVRAAMRSRREEGEEEVRWVRMSEVQVSDEASSRAVEEDGGGGLALKLDYKEVEEAWDKGRPFFSWPESEGPQIVPDLSIHHDFFYHHHHHHHNFNPGNGVLWGVPDQKSCIHEEGNGEQSIEGWRLGQREASVLRYKEKRMNRLFSKRIRYQVRKLNAEKRPRVKGRFVKRS